MASYNRKTISINFDRDFLRKNCSTPHSSYSAFGKVYERNKPRKVATPAWEIRSAYPLRGNTREYLNDKSEENSNCSCKRRARVCCKQTDRRKDAPHNKIWVVLFCVLLCSLMMTYSRLSYFILQSKFMTKVVPKTRLFSLLNMEPSVEEECCHVIKSLTASLLRAEQALRNTQRIRRLMIITSRTSKADFQSSQYERDYIDDATVLRGADTREWGGRVSLWGLLPLWRAGPPPQTVLQRRRPVPSDCWPFSGSYGEMILVLRQQTAVRRISIEHVRPDTAKSAPRNFLLYGILENGTWTKSIEAEYQARGTAKQFFELSPRNTTFQRLVLRILSNQGNPKYTCVYRVHLYRNGE